MDKQFFSLHFLRTQFVIGCMALLLTGCYLSFVDPIRLNVSTGGSRTLGNPVRINLRLTSFKPDGHVIVTGADFYDQYDAEGNLTQEKSSNCKVQFRNEAFLGYCTAYFKNAGEYRITGDFYREQGAEDAEDDILITINKGTSSISITSTNPDITAGISGPVEVSIKVERNDRSTNDHIAYYETPPGSVTIEGGDQPCTSTLR